MRRCFKCGEEKPTSAFGTNGKMGTHSYCKACRVVLSQEWRSKNPEKSDASRRKSALRSLYGLSVEDYSQMYEKQDGKCAICKRAQEYGKLAVDHSHKTNAVRGLLCKNCNSALGLLQDDPKIIENAQRYLEGIL